MTEAKEKHRYKLRQDPQETVPGQAVDASRKELVRKAQDSPF